MYLILLFYIIPTLFMWVYIHKSYSKNGQWSSSNVERSDLFITFTPLINIIAGLILGLLYINDKINWNSDGILNFIFRIKK